jgi:hypothetical protein
MCLSRLLFSFVHTPLLFHAHTRRARNTFPPFRRLSPSSLDFPLACLPVETVGCPDTEITFLAERQERAGGWRTAALFFYSRYVRSQPPVFVSSHSSLAYSGRKSLGRLCFLGAQPRSVWEGVPALCWGDGGWLPSASAKVMDIGWNSMPGEMDWEE